MEEQKTMPRSRFAHFKYSVEHWYENYVSLMWDGSSDTVSTIDLLKYIRYITYNGFRELFLSGLLGDSAAENGYTFAIGK